MFTHVHSDLGAGGRCNSKLTLGMSLSLGCLRALKQTATANCEGNSHQAACVHLDLGLVACSMMKSDVCVEAGQIGSFVVEPELRPFYYRFFQLCSKYKLITKSSLGFNLPSCVFNSLLILFKKSLPRSQRYCGANCIVELCYSTQ